MNPTRNASVDPLVVVIYGDDQRAIALAKIPTRYAKSKHIETQHHFVREAVADGNIKLGYVFTK